MLIFQVRPQVDIGVLREEGFDGFANLTLSHAEALHRNAEALLPGLDVSCTLPIIDWF